MRGWSQAELAAKCGVKQSTVSRWLHYKGIADLKVAPILLLEEAMGLAHGDLTLPATALRARRQQIDVHGSSSPLPADTARAVEGMVRKLLRKRSV